MDRDQHIVAVLARLSAAVSFLGGIAILGVLVVLTTLWTSRGFFAEFIHMMHDPLFNVLLICGIAAMALAPLIWHERIWAMLAALSLSGGILFMFGNETLALKVSLSCSTALFAITAAVRHWLGRAATR